MQNQTSPSPETIHEDPTGIALDDHPRRSIRRRANRRRLLLAGAVAGVALVVGTGFTVKSAAESQARIDATTALTEATGVQHDQLGAYSAIAAARTRATAEDTLSTASATLAAVDGKTDTTNLAASVASLGDYELLPVEELADLTKETRDEVAKASAAAAEYDREQEAKAKAAAEALARANTPDGARETARSMASSAYGWGDGEFQCLDSLWQKESGWSYTAMNGSSGATGIPQALPGSKMATMGADWQTNAATQIAWGLDYISRSYGSPCSAWSHSQAVNWY